MPVQYTDNTALPEAPEGDDTLLNFTDQSTVDLPNNILNAGEIAANNKSSIRALVVPHVSRGIETVMVDSSPIPPEISFYPFRGVNDRIEILLNSNTGRSKMRPVAIMPEDAAFFEDQYLQQTGMPLTFEEITAQGKLLEFASDDPVRSYQVFRVDSPPLAYADFNNNLLVDLDPDFGIPGELVDSVTPNQTYYYCARSRDIHGNLSNPTFVFEIELVDNNGQIFMRQEVYTFPTAEAKPVKKGRRFIYVEPSLQQTVLESEQVDSITVVDLSSAPPDSILGAMSLSDEFDSVWQKDFKLRITSTKTGRKLDLNIKFKNSGIVNQTE